MPVVDREKERELVKRARARGMSDDQIKQAVTSFRTQSGQVQQETQPQEEKVGGFQSLVQGVAKPFLKLGSSVAGIGEGVSDLVRGDVKGANEALSRERDFGYFGKTRPIGITDTGEQMGPVAGIKDIVGTGAELGSYVVGGGGAAGVGRATLGGAIKQGFKTGVQSGLIGGALQGGGAEAQRAGSTLGSIAGQTALGAGIGGATGGVLGGTLPIVGAGVRKVSGALTPEGRLARIVSSNKKALDTLETGNSRVRNAFVNAERSGISDIKDRIVQENYLVGSVDNNGRIRTSKPNGGLSKIDALITPSEKVVSDNIEREGKMISLDALEDYMMRNVQKSNIEGAAKKTALGKVASEIDGLRLDAVDNMIPLSKVQRLKIYKGRAINFADPDIQQADKSITNALKTFIEDNVDSIDVKTINKELSELYAIRDVLEALDGKVIKGGRLGKYFSQIIGATVGGHVGGPAGAVIGAEVGGRVQGGLLSRTLSKGTGKTPQVSKGMTEAISIGRSPLPKPPLIPESRRLMAPGAGNRPIIPLRGPTQIEKQAPIIGGVGQKPGTYSTNLGKRKTSQSTTPTVTRKPIISKTVPQNGAEIVNKLKKQPKLLSKISGEKSLLSEAKKYKTAEEFVKAREKPQTVRVWIKSKFSNGGKYADIPVTRRENDITLYQGGNIGENRQFWTPNKKYAERFGDTREKTGAFYKVDNGNRVTDVYVEAPTKSQLLDIYKKAHKK